MEARDARKSDPISLSICSSSKGCVNSFQKQFSRGLASREVFSSCASTKEPRDRTIPLQRAVFLDHFNRTHILRYLFETRMCVRERGSFSEKNIF